MALEPVGQMVFREAEAFLQGGSVPGAGTLNRRFFAEFQGGSRVRATSTPLIDLGGEP